MTSPDQIAASSMLDGVGLLVELIESRAGRQSLTDQIEHNQETGWAE